MPFQSVTFYKSVVYGRVFFGVTGRQHSFFVDLKDEHIFV